MHHEIVITEDGSPTYRQLTADGAEDMHNSSGAFSETLIIYGPVVVASFQQALQARDGEGPNFMSLGLGLGYNEVLIACQAIVALKNYKDSMGEVLRWTCHSYEKENWLIQDLLAYLGDELTPEKHFIYQKIFSLFAAHFAIPEEKIRKEMAKAYKEGRWTIESAFHYQLPQRRLRFHAYLWDAFSRKTDPDLWEIVKLENYLKATQAPSSFFSTYACFRDLKTALSLGNFNWKIRKAQTRKRESLIAWTQPDAEELLNVNLPELNPKISSHTQ